MLTGTGIIVKNNVVIKTLHKQVEYAKVVAINAAGKKVIEALKNNMRTVFRNPTPFTVNSLIQIRATKVSPVGIIKFKNFAGKGTTAGKYLSPQIFGGPRILKRSEQWLQQAGVLPKGMFMLPGAGAKRNIYGNMTGGQLTQILSVLGAHTEVGFNANTTSISRIRNKKLPNLFVINQHARLPMGVYQRLESGNIKLLLRFIRPPHYKKLFMMYEVGDKAFKDNIKAMFEQALKEAISTMR